MRHLPLITFVCVSLACSSTAIAQGLSKKAINKLTQSIAFEYQTHMKQCDTLNWNASDVCEAQARNKKLVDLAELRANAYPTDTTRHAALMAHVDANYEIAITECTDVPIEIRQPCWTSAETARDDEIEQVQTNSGMMSP